MIAKIKSILGFSAVVAQEPRKINVRKASLKIELVDGSTETATFIGAACYGAYDDFWIMSVEDILNKKLKNNFIEVSTGELVGIHRIHKIKVEFQDHFISEKELF